MRQVLFKNKFKKAYKLCEKRGKNLDKIDITISLLSENGELPQKYRPHKLVGNYAGEWECHIEPDWLMTYIINDEAVTLLDTGTHSDMFR